MMSGRQLRKLRRRLDFDQLVVTPDREGRAEFRDDPPDVPSGQERAAATDGPRARPYSGSGRASPYPDGGNPSPYPAGSGRNPYASGTRSPYPSGGRASPYPGGHGGQPPTRRYRDGYSGAAPVPQPPAQSGWSRSPNATTRWGVYSESARPPAPDAAPTVVVAAPIPDRGWQRERPGYDWLLTGSAGDGSDGRSGSTSRTAGRQGSGRRTTALAFRSVVVVGLIAALATSITRGGGHTPGTGTGLGISQGVSQGSPSPSMTGFRAAQSGANGATETTGQATPCRISYSVVPQGGQFTLAMMIANTSPQAINGWTLRWQFPSTERILSAQNAIVSNDPAGAVATGVGPDQVIGPGHSVTIAVAARRESWIPTPTGFTLNGQACAWQPSDAAAGPTEAPAQTP